MKAKFPLSGFLFLAALCLFLPSCSDRVEPIRIGVIAELSGYMSALGESTRKAAQMAADEINEGGGLLIDKKRYPVEIILEDNSGKEERSAEAALKLIRRYRVLAIVGPNASQYVLPAADIAERSETLLISPSSTSPRITLDEKSGKPKKFVFRACFTDSFQGRVIAKFILETKQLNKAAVLYGGDSEYNRELAHFFRDAYENGGGKVVAFETYKTGDRDFTAQLRKIKAARPEIVFLPNYYSEIPMQIRQAKKVGVTVPFIGSDSWGHYDLLDQCGPDCESCYFSSYYAADAPTAAAKKFINNYQSRYNRIPDGVAALTYDAFGLLWQGLKIAGTPDREKLRNAMAQIKKYEGVTGTLQFREGSGDPIRSAVILQIKDGQFVWFMNVNP